MGSIWKTVTAFFGNKAQTAKANNPNPKDQMDTQNLVTREDEDINDDSDSEDEDFVPTEKNEDPDSEISDDGDNEGSSKKKGKGKLNGKTSAKRCKNGNANGKRKRRKKNEDSDSDDDEDVDFVFHESHKSDEEVDNKPSAEEIAEQDALEKADTDRLWAEFLTSVDEDKAKRKERTVEKIVKKVYDFAGQKVEVQEKVKVVVTSDSKAGSGVIQNGSLSKNITAIDEPKPGPSSAMAVVASTSKAAIELQKKEQEQQQKEAEKEKPKPRRGGISILGNDPELIGLDELDKRGLSGLLKAFQTKAKRIGTLEKSKLDWEAYKRTQGLEEELHSHNKSRDTFIDKQEFLQRTDHRQFEIEKGMRATARSRRLAN